MFTLYFVETMRSLLFFLLLSLLPLLPAASTQNKYEDCKQRSYSCGHDRNISYPFRVPGMPEYCGHPGFEVSCKNNGTNQAMLVIDIASKEYKIYTINYDHEYIDLTRPDALGESCPRSFSNTTFDPSLFRFTDYDINMTLYFNCSPTMFPSSELIKDVSCPESSATSRYRSYYSLPGDGPPPVADLPKNCSSVVLIPMLDEDEVRLSKGRADFLGVLQDGFGLNWLVGRGWCGGCVDSGGACGRDPDSTDKPACFCPDGGVTDGKCGSSSRKNLRIVIGSVVGAGFLLVFLSLALYFHKRRKVSMSIIFLKKNINNNQRKIEAFLVEYGSLAPKRYRYSDVKKITKAFREKLGQGGYGTVFKGTLSNGKVVAVKILNDSKDDGEDFINEVASIGRTSHVNVVNLLGFCSEGSKRALIYEYMCNGSLEKLIYSEKPKTILDWEKLYQIALGIARGLEYLHRGCNTRMVHFDIKPHNILLDQDFCPKISDFGLAKLCLKKDSLISIAGARGTIGYIAPEVFSRNFGVVSSKSDVYSYGMMVLEIAGGKKNMHVGVENSSETYFPHWIYEHLDQNGDLLAYGVAAESEETVRKMIIVGLWCIQTMPQNRPPMSRVIEMLEGSINDLQVPPKSYLSSSPLGSLIGTSSIQDICWDDSSSLVHS